MLLSVDPLEDEAHRLQLFGAVATRRSHLLSYALHRAYPLVVAQLGTSAVAGLLEMGVTGLQPFLLRGIQHLSDQARSASVNTTELLVKHSTHCLSDFESKRSADLIAGLAAFASLLSTVTVPLQECCDFGGGTRVRFVSQSILGAVDRVEEVDVLRDVTRARLDGLGV